MNHAEFSTTMAQLTETYGERMYPPRRINQIREAVQNLTAEQWEDVVGQLIGSRVQAPMVPTIMEVAGPFFEANDRAEIARLDSQIGRFEECRWCTYRGTILAKVRPTEDMGETHTPAAFRCPYCSAWSVRRVSKKIPLWGIRWLETHWPQYGDGTLADPDDAPAPCQEPVPAERTEPAPDVPCNLPAVKQLLSKALANKKFPEYTQEELDL